MKRVTRDRITVIWEGNKYNVSKKLPKNIFFHATIPFLPASNITETAFML